MFQRAMLTATVTLLVLGTGCPHTYRKGGKLDRAMQKDQEEKFEERDREFKSVDPWDEEEEEEQLVCPKGTMPVRECGPPNPVSKCEVKCQ